MKMLATQKSYSYCKISSKVILNNCLNLFELLIYLNGATQKMLETYKAEGVCLSLAPSLDAEYD